jgi:hypothetical protein
MVSEYELKTVPSIVKSYESLLIASTGCETASDLYNISSPPPL